MKCRIFKLALFLILGAIVNVLVGWYCTLNWVDKPTSVLGSLKPRNNYGDFVVSSVTFGTHRKYFCARPGVAFTLEAPEGTLREELETDEIIFDLGIKLYDAFRYLEQSDPILFENKSELNEWDCAIHTQAGWPSLALIGIQHFVWPGGYITLSPRQHIGAFAIPGGWLGLKHGLSLPLRPIWPGFAINTIFYAAILWLLTLGPFTARRLIRRKRGHCIKCGYDLRGTEHEVCPECGVQVVE